VAVFHQIAGGMADVLLGLLCVTCAQGVPSVLKAIDVLYCVVSNHMPCKHAWQRIDPKMLPDGLEIEHLGCCLSGREVRLLH
jgi:hypothetical protein